MPKPNWSEANEKIVRGPYTYLRKVPGKDFRPQMIEAFNSVLKVDPERIKTISSIIEMLHTSSLLVDDVEDYAELRRGFPVAHSVFGAPQTINSANYIYFVALDELSKLGNGPEITKIYTEEMINLHRGQGLDLYWRDSLTCPSEEEYINMVTNKTGGLYRLAVRLLQACSPVEVDLTPLADLFGVIYQINDDYLNLQSSNYSKNKGFCEDLTEGKFSFPIIHSIQKVPDNKEILNILKQKTSDDKLKQYAVDYMTNVTHSFEYCKNVVEDYAEESRKLMSQIESSGLNISKLSAILDKMLSIS